MRMLSFGLAVCGAFLVGTPASAQQFTPADNLVMEKFCEPLPTQPGQPPRADGLACIYDKDGAGQIIGLAIGPYVQRRIGGEWYGLSATSVGFQVGPNFLFTTPNCAGGVAYLQTGSGQQSGGTPIENLAPFVAQVADGTIYGPIGPPLIITVLSQGTSPNPGSTYPGCSNFGPGSGSTRTARLAVAIDTTVFTPPFAGR